MPEQEAKPVTRYWLLLLAVTLLRVILTIREYGSATTRNQDLEAWKRELWDLENL